MNNITAFIAVKATPRAMTGYSDIAKTIAHFQHVDSIHLTSGVYDFFITLKCDNQEQVGYFVNNCLAPIDGIVSISTHFIIGRYKESGVELAADEDDRGLYTV